MQSIACVNPANARGYFRKCGIPGCDKEFDLSIEMEHQAAAIVTAIVAVSVVSVVISNK
jgi:hypothetical protein